ncbi:MAG: Glycosyl transferase, partial [candidate division WWE3 bacterium GW2011_GWB1_47_11]
MIFERVHLNNKDISDKTKKHHIARYEFAIYVKHVHGKCLDLACGSGYGSEMLRKAGYNVTGIDIDSTTIKNAKLEYQKVDFISKDIRTLRPTFKYDLITFFEAIEHLKFQESLTVLENASKMLKDDGLFIVSTPRDIN